MKRRYENYVSMPFEDYYAQYNREDYKTYKRNMVNTQGGQRLEQFVHALLNVSEFTVEKTTPKIDISFGADFLVGYTEDNRNHSVYVDVTTNTEKSIKYLKINGTLTDVYEDAFIANFSFGKVSFGLKFKHGGRFMYDKPVVVMVFQDINLRGKGIDATDTEVRAIEMFIKALNQILVDEYGCNKRASKIVYPNPKRL